ncbi:hypothetical protein DASC09_048040 [Saccharomycopsis crataegensis]|uniref:Uncharacterized protein n=1 Tax=Saccharomycopsis crataegensis TaxID=43959 RepID=A0AAV5QRU1_9ASCO|nr:hypothetical protein DASC09_048040 [Saccharomycopsis crataegensis]
MFYLSSIILSVVFIVAREYYNRTQKVLSIETFKKEIHQEFQRQVTNGQDSVREHRRKIEESEAQIGPNDRRIIQLMTTSNQKVNHTESLQTQLTSVVNEHEIIRLQLEQILELQSHQETTSNTKADGQNLENLKIELVVMQNNFNKLGEKLHKYTMNNQKIIKAINETSIKNFEINKEVEDILFNALKDIETENNRLRGLSKQLGSSIQENKLKIFNMLNGLNEYKDAQLVNFIELKQLQLKSLEEKLAMKKLWVSISLANSFKSGDEADFLSSYFPTSKATDLVKLKQTLSGELDQRSFEIESVEHEIKQAKKKFLL